MDVFIFLPLLSAALTLFLGIFVLIKGGRETSNIVFFLFSLFVSVWLGGTSLLLANCGNKNLALFWDRFIYFGVIFIPPTCYHFSVLFTKAKRNKGLIISAYLISAFFFLVSWTDRFVSGLTFYPWGCHTNAQLFHNLFLLNFAFFIGLVFLNLFKGLYQTTGIENIQIKYILVAFVILGLGILGFLPAYGINFYPLAYLFGLGAVMITAYAIIKHHLLNIKVIATELFSILLFIVLIVRFLLSESLNQFLLNGAITLSFVIFGILLIRSVWQEVRTREEIEKLANRLSDFVSFVTHELRTPVTKFKGALSNILSKTYGDVGNRNLEDILLKLQVVAQEMEQSIETFLAMNKIEIKKLELTLKQVDLNELFRVEINELQPMAKQKNIWLKFRPFENLPLVSADEFQIKHVLDNIISNAVKYTTENGHISVYFEIPAKGGEVITIVEDNGIGIEKETMPTLFSKYERGESSSRKFAEGTGLGLFLAKQIIEMHKGKIWAESEGKGKGSKFKFSLPVYAENASAKNKN